MNIKLVLVRMLVRTRELAHECERVHGLMRMHEHEYECDLVLMRVLVRAHESTREYEFILMRVLVRTYEVAHEYEFILVGGLMRAHECEHILVRVYTRTKTHT